MKTTPLVLVVGKSGSGKTTIVHEMCKNTSLIELQSYTTRKPRYTNEQGHIFTTLYDYEKDKRTKTVVAETYFDGNMYWSTIPQICNADFYILDFKGVKDILSWIKERKFFQRKVIIVNLDISYFESYKRQVKRGDKRLQVIKRILNDIGKFRGMNKWLIKHQHNKEYCDYELLFIKKGYAIYHICEYIERIVKNEYI